MTGFKGAPVSVDLPPEPPCPDVVVGRDEQGLPGSRHEHFFKKYLKKLKSVGHLF